MAKLQDASRDVGRPSDLTWPIIQISALVRIADSLEAIATNTQKMASNYTEMENNLRWYRDECHRMSQKIEHLKASRAGHMAAKTKLRKRQEKQVNDTTRIKADPDKSDPRGVELSENIQ
jgi:hypothetical protein